MLISELTLKKESNTFSAYLPRGQPTCINYRVNEKLE
jgi:hypothetical protein